MDAPAQTSVLNKPLLTFFSVIGLYIKVMPMGSTRVVRACSRFDYPVLSVLSDLLYAGGGG